MESSNQFYATGKRKNSVAKVWLLPGTGKIIVNDRDLDDYFDIPVNRNVLTSPLILTDKSDAFDVKITVMGGGHTGQAGAIRQGVSKALVLSDPDLRGVLKSAGFLTRDARQKERKKYGKKGARASFQFSKR
ncbi:MULTISPECIES: 30S ribosomal protein S9 [Desulfobacter]|jgi:small subunit ribosomal protein S9|uniref:Small ribosomal subunit protein uS9 n=1 Tax=Desulfobacter postgatei 2ac9 TaxID=879212 RepID=I5B4Z0_9BACT|nr:MULTISPECIES: 30S ribosomal protein S9 [Desulfobacter]EIM64553.1 ribosomal protein S9 [Desulfobacter postgatei 2ac9]MBP9599185.1 30S ribosomal protein S9 [Desulfobacter sp.]MDD4273299.1 30S ribosomal protein S9 [Desulfobacter postgatei]MDX9963803.1 30S ribosomal protein S9 [Desulfobacter postgatei]HBT89153.1 30S ribosomal protein S9 [Desulfobacter sp.]